jgi:TetR/AcrR family transcriptional regulator, transcriptional repressor for nem operon
MSSDENESAGAPAGEVSVNEERLASALAGGPSDADETRERILDLAKDILLRRSFNSFSYQDLADGIGIRKASIHYYFPSKEDLGVALLERIGAAMRRWAAQLREENAPPEEKLAAFCRVQRRLLDAGDKICVYGVLGAEYNSLPPRMQAAYSALLEAHQRWLARVLERGREGGVFSFAGSAEDEALIVSSTLQGGLQIARASRRADRFDAVAAALMARLRAPAASAG